MNTFLFSVLQLNLSCVSVIAPLVLTRMSALLRHYLSPRHDFSHGLEREGERIGKEEISEVECLVGPEDGSL